MNENLSLAIEKAVGKINPKDNFSVNQKNAEIPVPITLAEPTYPRSFIE